MQASSVGAHGRLAHGLGVHRAARALAGAALPALAGSPAAGPAHRRPGRRRRVRAVGRAPRAGPLEPARLPGPALPPRLTPVGPALGGGLLARAHGADGADARRRAVGGGPRGMVAVAGPRPLRPHLGDQPGISLLVLLLLALPPALLAGLPRRLQQRGLRGRAPRLRLLALGRASLCRPARPGARVSPVRELLGRLDPPPPARRGSVRGGPRRILPAPASAVTRTSGRRRRGG